MFLGWALTWAVFLAHDREWLAHPTYDEYWKRWSVDEDYGRITVPALHFTGWYDGFLRGTVDNYLGMSAVGHAEQRLVIWPWTHEPWAPVWGAEGSGLGFTSADDVHLAWFDRLLKGVAPAKAEAPRASSCSTTAGATSRRGHRRTRAHASSSSTRAVARTRGSATAPVRRAAGGGATGRLHVRPGPADLERGRLRLCVVDPEGCSRNLQETLVRARHRNGFEVAEPLREGEVVEYRLELGPVGVRVPSGHRLRLDIASSDFPMWDRNLNSGGPVGREGASAVRIAVQTVFHDAARPSRLVLPVVDPSGM